MDVSKVPTGYFFDNQNLIIGDKEVTVTAFIFTWGTSGKKHHVILVINAKLIMELPEDLGTILLELEIGCIFPVEQVIVDLDLGSGLKIIWQQNHRGRHLAELIDRVGYAPEEHEHVQSIFTFCCTKCFLVLEVKQKPGLGVAVVPVQQQTGPRRMPWSPAYSTLQSFLLLVSF